MAATLYVVAVAVGAVEAADSAEAGEWAAVNAAEVVTKAGDMPYLLPCSWAADEAVHWETAFPADKW